MQFNFSTPMLIRHLWQLKTVVFQHWCPIELVHCHGISELRIWFIFRVKKQTFSLSKWQSLALLPLEHICGQSQRLKALFTLQIQVLVCSPKHFPNKCRQVQESCHSWHISNLVKTIIKLHLPLRFYVRFAQSSAFSVAKNNLIRTLEHWFSSFAELGESN